MVVLAEYDYTKNGLKKDVEYIKEKVDTIFTCLYGNLDNAEDTGLIGSVQKNSSFRKNIKKWLLGVSALVSGILSKFVFEFFNKS